MPSSGRLRADDYDDDVDVDDLSTIVIVLSFYHSNLAINSLNYDMPKICRNIFH